MQAILIGATGLVGGALLRWLLEDEHVSVVSTFVRRSTGIQHANLKEYIVDFERIDEWAGSIKGDVLFSALGTTIKAAGSQEAQYRVDHDYQLEVAKAAKANGTDCLVLVSSDRADAQSTFFYLRMKGELEDHVRGLGFKRLRLVRPGPLQGHRDQPRPGESLAGFVLGHLPLIGALRRFKPVSGEKVARVCLYAAMDPVLGEKVIGPTQILAGR